MSHEVLQELPLFAGLTQADLDMLEARSQTISLAPGEVLMQEGTPGGSLYVILEGEFEIVKRSGAQDVLLAVRGPGEVIGEMSLLDQTPRTATVRALAASKLMEIHHEAFQHLLQGSPGAAVSILRTITSRLRNTEAMLRQKEKMAALGTLSAGLAHELNNPAAALTRSAGQLKDILSSWVEAGAALVGAGIDPSAIRAAFDRSAPSARPAPANDPLAQSRLESSLEAWLTEQGVDRAWDLAPSLAAAGWTEADLEAWAATVSSERRASWLTWVAWMTAAGRVLGEMAMSAGRISDIVGAVRSYAYLDRAPVQRVEVHAGLEDTLVILRHKLEPGVRVVRRYDEGLPAIEGFGSELNQVWTNLIDNAVQAMHAEGELSITTSRQDEEVLVEICDNGPGIPPEIRERIFEPFFTTKPPGSGSGLGLHLVYNIVVHRHAGRIEVDSHPGRTCFAVRLPMRLRGPDER
ncbi:MAG TPA: ATP-binding protein [Anaerolineales bacterium]|nr:ATP-binding protein [Anaerolineales bacterium]